jgi:hypothetical protein
MAWYMRTTADANSTDAYLPKTTPEKAGAPGGPNGAAQPIPPTNLPPRDSNYTFASTITPGNERVPYPVGGGGGGAYLTTVAAVECDPTLSVPNV